MLGVTYFLRLRSMFRMNLCELFQNLINKFIDLTLFMLRDAFEATHNLIFDLNGCHQIALFCPHHPFFCRM